MDFVCVCVIITCVAVYTQAQNHVLADISTWLLGKIYFAGKQRPVKNFSGRVCGILVTITSWRSLVFWSNENDRECDLLHTNAKQGCWIQGSWPRSCRHGCPQDRNLQTGMEKINSEQSQVMHVHALQFDKVSWVCRETYNPIALRLRWKNHKLPWAAY